MKKMQYLQRCIFQKFGNHLLIVFHLETYKPGKRFSSEVKGELVFLNTLLRRNNNKVLCIGI